MILHELPEELLIQILCCLSLADLLRCTALSRSFRQLVQQSVKLQFIIHTAASGTLPFPITPFPYAHNTHCICTAHPSSLPLPADNYAESPVTSLSSTHSRLSVLKQREQSWQDVSIDFTTSIAVQHHPSGIYDLTGGSYLLGSIDRSSLYCLKLPVKDASTSDRLSAPSWWRKIDIKSTFIDIGLCILEADLMAVVTVSDSSDPRHYDIELLLLQFSTGQPHPCAVHPRFFVTRSRRLGSPGISIEIVGENLVLILTYYNHPFSPDDEMFVYDWTTGRLKLRTSTINCSWTGVIFLSSDVILVPNRRKGCFELWEIPGDEEEKDKGAARDQTTAMEEDDDDETELDLGEDSDEEEQSPKIPKASLCLNLPILNPGHLYSTISCRGEPNPISRFRRTRDDQAPNPTHQTYEYRESSYHTTQPFVADPMEAIVIFNMRVIPPGPQPARNFTMFVHRKALLQVFKDFKETQRRKARLRVKRRAKEKGKGKTQEGDESQRVTVEGNGTNDSPGLVAAQLVQEPPSGSSSFTSFSAIASPAPAAPTPSSSSRVRLRRLLHRPSSAPSLIPTSTSAVLPPPAPPQQQQAQPTPTLLALQSALGATTGASLPFVLPLSILHQLHSNADDNSDGLSSDSDNNDRSSADAADASTHDGNGTGSSTQIPPLPPPPPLAQNGSASSSSSPPQPGPEQHEQPQSQSPPSAPSPPPLPPPPIIPHVLASIDHTPIRRRRRRRRGEKRASPEMPWAAWGPGITRWFNSDGVPTRWITTSCGQRTVFTLTDPGQPQPQPQAVVSAATAAAAGGAAGTGAGAAGATVGGGAGAGGPSQSQAQQEDDFGGASSILIILDFNQMNVAKAAAEAEVAGEVESSDEEGEEEREREREREQGQEGEEVEVVGRSELEVVEEVPMEEDILMVVNEPESGEPGPSMRRPSTPSGANQESRNTMPKPESKSDKSTAKAKAEKKKKNAKLGHKRIVQKRSELKDHGMYGEVIEHGLGYIALSARVNERFEGVLMDEERLIGIRTDELDRVRYVDIMHIGAVTGKRD